MNFPTCKLIVYVSDIILSEIVGLILFLVWKDSRTKNSKIAGKGALIYMPQWFSVLALRLYTCEPYSLIYEYLLMPMFWEFQLLNNLIF